VNPQDPLANLHPLREPEMVSWWPLAPGWWVLIVISLLLLAFIAWRGVRRYRANAYRRVALRQLEETHRQWLVDGDSHRYVVAVNSLLKSVALRAFPKQEVASYSGTQWMLFLNSGLRGSAPSFPDDFANAVYRKHAADTKCEALHETSIAWIRHHGASS